MYMLPPAEQQIDGIGRASLPPAGPTAYPIPVPVPDQSASGPAGIQTLTAYLWRRKWAVVAATIFGLLMGVLVSLLTKPIYRAHTSLQLEGFNEQTFREVPVSQLLPNASPENYLQNEVKVLNSDTLARRVAEELGPAAEDQRQRASTGL